jgi:acyl carrier protein
MEQRLRKIMVDLLNIREDTINDSLSMQNTESWDSLKHMALILSIEEEFGIPQLSMDEIVEMTTVAKIKQVLRNKGVTI